MKLLYITPNLINMSIYMTNILNGNYKNNNTQIDPVLFKHSFAIIRIDKDNDIQNEMFKFILSNNNQNVLIETQTYYYLRLSISNILDIIYTEIDNTFKDNLSSLLADILSFINSNSTKNLRGDYISYPINYVHKLEFNIIHDIKYLVTRYFNILQSNDEISREDLNKLFHITIHFKLPIYLIRELYRTFNIISDSNYSTYTLEFDKIQYNRSKKCLKLSSLIDKNSIDINADAILVNTTQDRLITNMHNIYRSHIDSEYYESELPLSTLSDVFISLSLDELSKFSDNTYIYENNKLYTHMKSVIWILLSSYNMEYILLDKIRG